MARLAGVSEATVSRALAGKLCVRAETRARVITAAKKLRYVPNVAARTLASGVGRTIGVVFPDSRDAVFLEGIHTIISRAASDGYETIVRFAPLQPGGDTVAVRALAAFQVAGILAMFSAGDDERRRIVRWARDQSMPLVGIAGIPFAIGDHIAVDYEHVYRRLFEGVLGDGLRRVAAVLSQTYAKTALSELVRQQWDAAVRSMSVSDAELAVLEIQVGTDDAQNALQSLQARWRTPFAIVAPASLVIGDLIRGASKTNLRIPNDLVLAGGLHWMHAGYSGSRNAWCIDWSIDLIARIALQHLRRLISDGYVGEQVSTVVKPRIVRLGELETEASEGPVTVLA